MSFQRVYSGAPWERINGYCRALRAGHQIFVTGTTSLEEDGSIHAPGDGGKQVTRCYEIIERALQELGAARHDLVRSRMFVTDLSQAEACGHSHKAFFGSHDPCLTLVGIAGLVHPEMVVEVEAEAIILP